MLVVGLVVALVAVVGAGAGGGYWWWRNRVAGSGLLLEGEGARIADTMFAAGPGAAGDGANQQLLDAAAVGETAVAVGVNYGSSFYRPLFLVSEDAGTSWRLATVTAADGGDVPLNEYPGRVVASDDGWVALSGRVGSGGAVWTSDDGRTWTREGDASDGAFGENDTVNAAARAGSEVIAVGATYPGGDYASQRPVLWWSADGLSWQRIGAGWLDLPTPNPVRSLDEVAAYGDRVLLTGTLANATPVAWLSSDGGGAWQQVALPGSGGSGSVEAVAVSDEEFLLVYSGLGDNYEPFVGVLSSPDGRSWTELGRVEHPAASAAGGAEIVAGSGGYALALSAGYGQETTVVTSTDGRAWRIAGTFRSARASFSRPGLVVAAGNAIAVGSTQDGGDVDPVLAVAPGGGALARIDPGKIPGVIHPDRSLSDVATAGGATVAVGSANGAAAVWASDDAATWRRAGGSPESAGAERGRLRAVAKGDRGWLAAGYGSRSGNPMVPLLRTSGDGREWRPVDDEVFRNEGDGPLLPYAAAAGPAGYAVVGVDTADDYSSTSAAAWHSRDLRTWRRAEGADMAGARMFAVAAGPFGFVAVGGVEDPNAPEASNGRPAIWTSQDGEEWSLEMLSLPEGAESADFDLVASKEDTIIAMGAADRPIAAPNQGVSAGSGGFSFAYASADGGESWEPVPAPAVGDAGGTRQEEESFVTDLAVSPQGFVAVGTVGPSGGQNVVVWTSRDGRSWEEGQPEGVGLSGPGEQVITGVAVVRERLVGVGYTADYRQEYPTVWETGLP